VAQRWMTLMWACVSGGLCLSVWAAHSTLTGHGVPFTPWRWAALVLWLAYVFFGAAASCTLLLEGRPRAAAVCALFFAASTAILGAVLAMAAGLLGVP